MAVTQTSAKIDGADVSVFFTDNMGTKGLLSSFVAAFDLAYQQFAESKGIKTPRFIVHDVLENIEGKVLRDIIARASTCLLYTSRCV